MPALRIARYGMDGFGVDGFCSSLHGAIYLVIGRRLGPVGIGSMPAKLAMPVSHLRIAYERSGRTVVSVDFLLCVRWKCTHARWLLNCQLQIRQDAFDGSFTQAAWELRIRSPVKTTSSRPPSLSYSNAVATCFGLVPRMSLCDWYHVPRVPQPCIRFPVLEARYPESCDKMVDAQVDQSVSTKRGCVRRLGFSRRKYDDRKRIV